MRLLVNAKTNQSFLVNPNEDFFTKEGKISKADLTEKSGAQILTAKKHPFIVLDPTFHDLLNTLKRGAQVILPKDAAYILARTGANKSTTVVDAGGGSGWLSCFLANYTKKVYCYDINKKHLSTIKKNIKLLQQKNIEVEEYDIYQGVPHKADVLTLDVPEPWQVLTSAKKKIAPGGYIVSYNTSVLQALTLVNEAKEQNFLVEETLQIQHQPWLLEGKKSRPVKDEIGPTGFITFIRNI